MNQLLDWSVEVAKVVFMSYEKTFKAEISAASVNDFFDFLCFFIANKEISSIFVDFLKTTTTKRSFILRDDYLQAAQSVITDPNILINVVSRRAKQLKNGYKPLIESLERLSAEDIALREIVEGKISYQLDEKEQPAV